MREELEQQADNLGGRTEDPVVRAVVDGELVHLGHLRRPCGHHRAVSRVVEATAGVADSDERVGGQRTQCERFEGALGGQTA